MGRLRLILAAIAVAAAVTGLVIGGQALTAGEAPPVALGPPRFVDETATAGIDHTYGGERHFVGGGVAVFDCSGDGLPDVYIAGGEGPAALYRNGSVVGAALRFARLADPVRDLTDVTGAYPLDVDGDGLVDLAVLRLGENVALRGLGDCRFERANEAWSIDGSDAWTTAFSARWEGPASRPTLAFGNYVDLSVTGSTAGGLCPDHQLFRPDATTGRYRRSSALAPGYCTLSMLFSDWDRSGRADLRITNDRHYHADGEDQLWRVAEGEPPRLYTADEGWVRMQIWGMGIASRDLTDDGYPEVYLTSQADNKLQTLAAGPGQPRYRDIALRRGANVPRPFAGGDVLPSTAWHPEFADVNNDGFVDLFVSKGNVNAMPDFAQRDPSNLLLGQADGTFRESAEDAGILSFARGRGAALADFNADGLLDLVEVNYGDPVRLWRNVGAGDEATPAGQGNWLGLRLAQATANRDAIGAWIEVRIGERTQLQELTVGGGHAGGQLGWIHVGLGAAERAEVRVQWPDGRTGAWLPLEANRFVIIDRDAAEPRIWQPPVD